MGGNAQQYSNPIQSLPFGAPTQQGQIQQLLKGDIGALPPSGNPMGPGPQGQPAPQGGGVGFQGPGVGGGGMTPGSGNPMAPGPLGQPIPDRTFNTGPGMRGTPAPGSGTPGSIAITGEGHSTPTPQGPAGPMQSQYNPSPQFLQNLQQQMGQLQQNISRGQPYGPMGAFGTGGAGGFQAGVGGGSGKTPSGGFNMGSDYAMTGNLGGWGRQAGAPFGSAGGYGGGQGTMK